MMKTVLLAAAAALLPVAALSHDGVGISDAYARSANPKTAAAFMVLSNHRDSSCRLQGVASEIAERVELHTSLEEGGVMKMVRLEEEIEIEPYASHNLARGGDHVMFLGVKQPLKDGDVINLTLDFGDCGTETVEVPVDNARAPAAGGAAGEMQGQGH